MKKILLLAFCALLPSACSKAKENLSKTGDAVGQSAAVFFHSVADGVDKTLQCSITITPALADKGLTLGNDKVSSFAAGGRNVLTAYLIFSQDFNDTVTVKVYDTKGNEYGRTTQKVTGKKGDAKNVEFTFDPHTSIETMSKFELE